MVWVQKQFKTQRKAPMVLNPIATGGQVWWKNIPENHHSWLRMASGL